MDFERAKIKALYYDYLVEDTVRVIKRGDVGYLDVFSQIARWREQAFSITEMDALKRQIAADYTEDNAESLLRMLLDVSSQFLRMSLSGEPILDYKNLLRWQDIVSLVGEDLLVVPYVAQKDIKMKRVRTTFMWQDVLHHSNKSINDILNQGLTDVHAHFNATVDVFHLNWIAMMNGKEIAVLSEIVKQKMRTYPEQYVRIPNHSDPNIAPYSMVNMVVAAAYIRLRLWEILNNYKQVDDLNIQTIETILSDRAESVNITRGVICNEIAGMRHLALRDYHNEVLDYMILDDSIPRSDRDNIFIIYNGERSFLYQIFRRLIRSPKTIKDYLPLVYLYLLIKGHIRSFFVQNNQLVGFENFQLYEKWKSAAIQKSPLWSHHAQFVLQSTIRPCKNDYLEGRVSVFEDKHNSFSQNYVQMFQWCNRGVISGQPKCSVDKLSIVYHFIKSGDFSEGLYCKRKDVDNVGRFATYRKELHTKSEQLVRLYAGQRYGETSSNHIPKLTGIDAAGNELYCRPEVFAHAFRYCRRRGMVHQTYHVGEDFLDIVDGLRAIDEAIRFLEMDDKCRIGHALALGTDAEKYYNSRHLHSVLPRQNCLDNCVWLIKSAKSGLTKSMINKLLGVARTQYAAIGYGDKNAFDVDAYWHSMQLRGCDIDYICAPYKVVNTDWQLSAIQDNDEVDTSLKDENGVALYEMYHRSDEVKKHGLEIVDMKWPIRIILVVEKLQSEMREMIMNKGIAIESNPTSNYKIGRFDRYDELPLYQFYPMKQKAFKINTSINTDDRGVFATSIEREYSLVCLALEKKRYPSGKKMYNKIDIRNYIEQIRKNAESQRFA